MVLRCAVAVPCLPLSMVFATRLVFDDNNNNNNNNNKIRIRAAFWKPAAPAGTHLHPMDAI